MILFCKLHRRTVFIFITFAMFQCYPLRHHHCLFTRQKLSILEIFWTSDPNSSFQILPHSATHVPTTMFAKEQTTCRWIVDLISGTLVSHPLKARSEHLKSEIIRRLNFTTSQRLSCCKMGSKSWLVRISVSSRLEVASSISERRRFKRQSRFVTCVTLQACLTQFDGKALKEEYAFT